ncbi:MAG: HEPN domain-containing protein [Candidatus Atribacteria bacterium]|nr:HEPN domain-containing protein [Candidatus Atribacteria bacterium]
MPKKGPRAEAERWFRQAEQDLKDAEYLEAGERFHLACFMSQQAAEKAIKAFLYAHGAEFVWGHSVAELCEDAKDFDPSFAEVVSLGGALDKYYVPTRYPNGLPGGIPAEAYTGDDARMAISLARQVLEFVARKLRSGKT